MLIQQVNRLLLMLLLGLTFACSHHQEVKIQKPDPFLEQDVFTNIMVDIRLIESAIRQKVSTGSNDKELSKWYYDDLFAKYKINAQQLEANIMYYAQNPEEMAIINERVVERLTTLESEVKTQRKVHTTH